MAEIYVAEEPLSGGEGGAEDVAGAGEVVAEGTEEEDVVVAVLGVVGEFPVNLSMCAWLLVCSKTSSNVLEHYPSQRQEREKKF